MVYTTLADLVLVTHLVFILFAVLGGLLVLKRRRLVWIHLVAAAWAVLIELGNWVCPLTPLENYLRRRAGQGSYEETFVEHYLMPVIYPAGLTRPVQILLGLLVIGVNLVIYSLVMRQRRPTR